MDNRIRDAFDQIHADFKMVDSTMMKLSEVRSQQEAGGFVRSRRRGMGYRAAVAAAMIAIVIFVFGFQLTVTEAAYVSVDGASSIELILNPMGRVIRANVYDDGAKLLGKLKLKGKGYEAAMDEIMQSEAFRDGKISVTMVSLNDKKSEKVKEKVTHHDPSCQLCDKKDYDEAHDHGMTVGQYKHEQQVHEEQAKHHEAQKLAKQEKKAEKKAAHEAAHESHKKELQTAKEMRKATHEEAHDKTHENGHSEKHIAKKSVKKTVKKSVKKTHKKAHKTTHKTTHHKKVAKKATKKAAKKAAKKTHKKTHKIVHKKSHKKEHHDE